MKATFYYLCLILTPSASFANDGSLARTLVAPILAPFRYDITAIILSLAIFLAAWIVLSFYNRTSYLPMLRDIRAVSRKFSASVSTSDFTSSFEDTDNFVQSVKSFSTPWQEFKETLILVAVDDRDGEPMWHNTRRPSEYFNIRSIDRTSGSFFNLEAFPNIFVGVGLLLTFIGLIAAIDEAGRFIGGDGQDASRAVSALQQMLTIASVKFLTSISGIASSIWLTIAYRNRKTKLDAELKKLNERIENCVEFLPNEKLQIRTVNAIDGLSSSIARGVSDGVTNTIGSELRLFGETLDNFTDTFSSPSKSVNEFQSSYQAALNALRDDIASTLGSVTNSFDKFKDDARVALEATVENMVSVNKEIKEQLRDELIALNEDLGTKMLEAVSSAGQISESNANLTEGIRELMQSFSLHAADSTKIQDASIQIFQEKLDELGKYTQELAEAANQAMQALSGSEDSIDSVVTKIREENREFNRNQAAEFREVLEAGLSSAEKLNNELSLIFGKHQATVDKLNDLVEGHLDERKEYFDKLLESLDNQSDQIDDLRKAIEENTAGHEAALLKAISKIKIGSRFSIFGKS